MSTKQITPKKVAMFEKTQRMFTENDKFMFVDLFKVQSTQFKNCKNFFPQDVKFLFAKNKIMKKALEEINKDGKFDHVIPEIKENTIVAFFDKSESASEVYRVCQLFRRNAFARFGDVAEDDVVVPTGPTGLGPDQIQLFHAAKMNTKIVKGKIEIAAAHKLVAEGEVVGISEANLLAKLNIMPFNFGLNVLKVFEGKEIYGKEVLAISDETIENSLKEACARIAAISLGTDTLTDASAPYEIMSASNEIKKIAAGLDYII